MRVLGPKWGRSNPLVLSGTLCRETPFLQVCPAWVPEYVCRNKSPRRGPSEECYTNGQEP